MPLNFFSIFFSNDVDGVPCAATIVCDEFARHELRLRASGFTALMSANVDLHRFFPDGTPSCVEVGVMAMTRSEHWALADEGCRGIARAAFRPPENGREPVLLQKLSVESRNRLNDAGAPAAVLTHLRWGGEVVQS